MSLLEQAHWCVAGEQRRQQLDYGYWYAPDGRSADQQLAFEQVEVKPQALEWVFSQACGQPFRVSADNLEQAMGASLQFKEAIVKQAQRYVSEGLPARARCFAEALVNQCHSGVPVSDMVFSLSSLQSTTYNRS